MKKQLTAIAVAAILGSGLVACGSSDTEVNGFLTVAITDAPVDGATEVVVKFDAIELKPQQGASFTITYDEPQSIDLLALQNGDTAPLLQNETLEAGEYNWMRLQVDADVNEMDSYISFEDGSTFSLNIPSGSTTGLKLNRSFVITAGGNTNLTIDFDLRKSVHKPGNSGQDYMLRPTLRMIDNSEVGTISGFILPSVVADTSCEAGLAVYAYSGADITPDDEGSATSPLTSSMPVYDADTDRYDYQLSFMPTGDYTVALTCDADVDDPEVDESDEEWGIIAAANETVELNQTTELNFE